MFGKQKFAGKQMFAVPCRDGGTQRELYKQALLSVPQSTITSSYYTLFMVMVPLPETSPLSKHF